MRVRDVWAAAQLKKLASSCDRASDVLALFESGRLVTKSHPLVAMPWSHLLLSFITHLKLCTVYLLMYLFVVYI